MPCTVCTPEPCTMHHTYLPYTPTPLLSLHRSLPCLPHSKLACTHDLHMHTHIDMPLSIDTFPCHALYTPLGPAPHTYVPPSHLYPFLCPHKSLPSLPHSITACTHDHHMPAHISMPLPIDACAHNRHDAHDAHDANDAHIAHDAHTMHIRCTRCTRCTSWSRRT